MQLPDVLAAVMWIGVTAYALFGGADFGAGFWDLLAGSAREGHGCSTTATSCLPGSRRRSR
jgi:cytochrome bd-type quinol oxidase subunit 2